MAATDDALRAIIAALFHMADAHEQMAAIIPNGSGAVRIAMQNVRNALAPLVEQLNPPEPVAATGATGATGAAMPADGSRQLYTPVAPPPPA